MCREELMIILEENECIVYPDLEDALVGCVENSNGEIVALYDIDKIVDIFMDRDGMTYEEAVEYYDFNVARMYVGAKTPLLANLVTEDENFFDDDVE